MSINTGGEVISFSIIAQKWASWLQSFHMGVKVSIRADNTGDCLLSQDERLLQLISVVCRRAIFIHVNDMNSSQFITTVSNQAVLQKAKKFCLQ